MGLTSFWSTITGPKVKEITPQTQCKWFDKARPGTSASTRTAKKNTQLRLRPDILVDPRIMITADQKKDKKKDRGLHTSKQKPEEVSNRKKESGRVIDPAEKDLPDVPSPSPTFRHELDGSSSHLPAHEPVRPGTAITTDGSVATEVFELSGAPSPAIHSPSSSVFPPLPSPASLPPASWDRNSGPTTIEPVIGLRKRSNSTTSGKSARSRIKRASWFHSSRRKEVDISQLPPPLPPPTGRPPPTPLIQPLVAELPDNGPSLKRSVSLSSSMTRSPVSPITRISLDGDSIMMAFPPTPTSPRGSAQFPETSALNVETGSVVTKCWPNRKSNGGDRSKKLPTAVSARPHIAAPMQTIDTLLNNSNGVCTPPKHDSKLSSARQSATETAGETGLSFSEELQREYDKVTRKMDRIQQEQSKGPVVSVKELDPRTMEQRNPAQHFSNEEALAALEFGI